MDIVVEQRVNVLDYVVWGVEQSKYGIPEVALVHTLPLLQQLPPQAVQQAVQHLLQNGVLLAMNYFPTVHKDSHFVLLSARMLFAPPANDDPSPGGPSLRLVALPQKL